MILLKQDGFLIKLVKLKIIKGILFNHIKNFYKFMEPYKKFAN
jgi:hypothetical protein